MRLFCFALLFCDCWGATVKKLLRRNHLRRRSCQSHRTFHFVPHFISCEDLNLFIIYIIQIVKIASEMEGIKTLL